MKAVWKDTVIADSDDTVVVEGNHYFPVIADSDDTVVVEGNHYFPADAVKADLIENSDKTTTCPWKGTAHYYHVVVGDARNADAAWYYPEPKAAASEITGRVAFWRGVNVTD